MYRSTVNHLYLPLLIYMWETTFNIYLNAFFVNVFDRKTLAYVQILLFFIGTLKRHWWSARICLLGMLLGLQDQKYPRAKVSMVQTPFWLILKIINTFYIFLLILWSNFHSFIEGHNPLPIFSSLLSCQAAILF